MPTTAPNESIKVLFVCLGNICRSPLAEGIFRQLVEEERLTDRIEIDSAGTGNWHVGDAPDRRMQATAKRYGVDLSQLRGRQVVEDDLSAYDHIFAMDKSNLHDILALDAEDAYGNRVRLFREFDPEPGDFQVPDPYYGGDQGFENVYQIVHRTAQNLLDLLIDEHDLK